MRTPNLPPGFDFTDPDIYAERLPVDELAEMRKVAPIWWNEQPKGVGGFDDGGFWVVTKHKDVKEVSVRSDVFSSLEKTALPRYQDGAVGEHIERGKLVLLNMDAPHHTHLRKIISRAFTPRAVERLRDELNQRAQNIAKAAAEEGCGDFVEQVSAELPLQAIAGLMGVPQEDRMKLFHWSNQLVGNMDPEFSDNDSTTASVELIMYGMQLAAERADQPGEDLVTKLVRADVEGHKLSDDELGFFVILLAVAGNETTRNSITQGMMAFADFPDQWELFKSKRPATAADEIVRWATPVTSFQRTALEDEVEDPMFSERIYEKMYNGSRSTPALERGVAQADESRRRGVIMEAIAGVDIAVWDVKAQALGIPLYQALGAARSSVRGYASGGWAPGDEAEAELAGYAAKGFTAAKMRVVGRDGFSIAKCVRRVQAARRGLGPSVELMVDAHGSLEVATAIKLARELEPFDIAWFEEPVSPDDHAGQAEVRRATTIPIASGEREFTRFDFQDLLERRALDIAQPDVARAGGMTEIRRIAALTSAHGVRLAPHAWGSGVLFAASLHVAMAAPNCHILEVTQGYMPMMWELFNEPFDIRPDGTVHAPDRPGLGFTLRADALDRFRYVDGPEFEF